MSILDENRWNMPLTEEYCLNDGWLDVSTARGKALVLVFPRSILFPSKNRGIKISFKAVYYPTEDVLRIDTLDKSVDLIMIYGMWFKATEIKHPTVDLLVVVTSVDYLSKQFNKAM
jgi:hypothetical protein